MLSNVTLLQNFLINSASEYADKEALIAGKSRITYGQLLSAALKLSYELKKNGVERGDRVVVHCGNSVYTVVAFWAILMADGIVSVIANDQPEEKVEYIINDSGAKIFITTKASEGFLDKLRSYKSLEHIVLMNNADPSVTEIFSFNGGNDQSIKGSIFKNNELDLAAIIYTSGSTGEPKGVMLTHRNMIAATFSINEYLEHVNSDIILSALPLSFDYGLYQMIMAFSVGATLVLEKDALLPAFLLKKIEKEKATILPGVPTLFSLLAEHADHFDYNFSSLRAVTNTGAALTPKHIGMVQSVFPTAKVYSMYGLTECKRCTYLPPSDVNRKITSVGVAIPNTELWLVDENDCKLGPGEVGQLVIRGATVMKGYWNKPEATSKKLKDGPLPGEKVLYTGDLAMLDEDGYLYFKGRMDEVVKFKGMKVSPVEIENHLSKLDAVNEVAVFAVDNTLGEAQLIVCVGSATESPEQERLLVKKIKMALPCSQQPSMVMVLTALPKNNNGKIDKKTLKSNIQKKYCSDEEAKNLESVVDES